MATPLIKWYQEHGLDVTHIYQVIEYTPVPCFQPFVEAVSDARRAGDLDLNKAIIADTMKLVSTILSEQVICLFYCLHLFSLRVHTFYF